MNEKCIGLKQEKELCKLQRVKCGLVFAQEKHKEEKLCMQEGCTEVWLYVWKIGFSDCPVQIISLIIHTLFF